MAALRGLGAVELDLTNPTARNLLGFEVEVFLPEGVVASRGKADEPPHLPKAPLPWGRDTIIASIASVPMWTVPGLLPGWSAPGMRHFGRCTVGKTWSLYGRRSKGAKTQVFLALRTELAWLSALAVGTKCRRPHDVLQDLSLALSHQRLQNIPLVSPQPTLFHIQGPEESISLGLHKCRDVPLEIQALKRFRPRTNLDSDLDG
jgi:hypothetical protein